MIGPTPRKTGLLLLAVAALIVPALTRGAADGPRLVGDPIASGQPLGDFAARRAALRKAAGNGMVLLIGGPAGEEGKFRPESNLFYLTGVSAPSAALAIVPPDDPLNANAALYLPPTGGAATRFGEAYLSPGPDAVAATGIDPVHRLWDMWDELTPSIRKAPRVYILGPVGEAARYTPAGRTIDRIRAINPDAEILDVGRLIAPMRLRKSAAELDAIRAAGAATIEGMEGAARSIRPGATELAVEGEILAGFRRKGAAREGFPCIVGSGPNATVLHHTSSERAMAAGELVVVDIGAEVRCFSGDVTRTFPVGGKFTPRQRQVYDLVLAVQKAASEAVVPGKTTLGDLNALARRLFRESPLRARADDGTERTMDTFFAHSISHWLGMDVHDVGSMAATLEPGMVLTIEPGLYIPGEGIGIRIEDDFAVTDRGAEKLTPGLPSDAAGIEKLMRSKRTR